MSSTANPRHPNNPLSDPKAEPTGIVAKDSLANESIKSGGAFGDNANPEVLGVKGHQSTLANTDTTNADTIPPASSRSARGDQDTSTKYPDAAAGKGFEGTHSDQGYRGGSTLSSGGGAATTAPSYAADTSGTSHAQGDLKPKGDNLVEGGDIPPNRSTFTGDVGGPNDPGRLAERTFQKLEPEGSAGTGARDYSDGGENKFDALQSSERA